ncbi:MAG: winged helix-turn-helix transcriptional regulator [Candidatus Kariarchaeaceae archaeon]|jgi:DNA-binding HxlR family transcriptional regulator
MVQVKKCPIEVAFYRTSIGKKWTLTIIRDLIFGKTRFTDFLKTNPSLSSKVLAERLKELEGDGIIKKRELKGSPLITEYYLTEKGVALNKILYELSIFGSKYYPEEVFAEDSVPSEDAIEIFGYGFKIPEDQIAFNKSPLVIKS